MRSARRTFLLLLTAVAVTAAEPACADEGPPEDGSGWWHSPSKDSADGSTLHRWLLLAEHSVGVAVYRGLEGCTVALANATATARAGLGTAATRADAALLRSFGLPLRALPRWSADAALLPVGLLLMAFFLLLLLHEASLAAPGSVKLTSQLAVASMKEGGEQVHVAFCSAEEAAAAAGSSAVTMSVAVPTASAGTPVFHAFASAAEAKTAAQTATEEQCQVAADALLRLAEMQVECAAAKAAAKEAQAATQKAESEAASLRVALREAAASAVEREAEQKQELAAAAQEVQELGAQLAAVLAAQQQQHELQQEMHAITATDAVTKSAADVAATAAKTVEASANRALPRAQPPATPRPAKMPMTPISTASKMVTAALRLGSGGGGTRLDFDAGEERRQLWVTVHKAKGIRDVQMFGKMSPYVELVALPSEADQVQGVRTKAVSGGGASPVWSALHDNVMGTVLSHGDKTARLAVSNSGLVMDSGIGVAMLTLADCTPTPTRMLLSLSFGGELHCTVACGRPREIEAAVKALRRRHDATSDQHDGPLSLSSHSGDQSVSAGTSTRVNDKTVQLRE